MASFSERTLAALPASLNGQFDLPPKLAMVVGRGIFINPTDTKLYLSLTHDAAVCDAVIDRLDDALAQP